MEARRRDVAILRVETKLDEVHPAPRAEAADGAEVGLAVRGMRLRRASACRLATRRMDHDRRPRASTGIIGSRRAGMAR